MSDDLIDVFETQLSDLCTRIRSEVRALVRTALESGTLRELARQVGQGVGDVTFGIDVPAEAAVEDWRLQAARSIPLSVLTEGAGWRHMDRGAPRSDFGHAGPRIAIDPIDGTRHLMTDLRSAWVAAALAGPGASPPRQSEVELGIVSEIPDSRAAVYRELRARRGEGCWLEIGRLPDEISGPARGATDRVSSRKLVADDEVLVDHAYFPFFKYCPDLRPEIATIEARFFERLAREEAADVRNCYDDQYICNAGQLVHLALGDYRMIADLRAWIAAKLGRPTVTSKPYDLAAALLCASEAGCVLTAPDGMPLDFTLDAETPLSFVGYANAATRERLEPHLQAVLRSL